MGKEEMELLLNDRFAPITSSMGFIEGECSIVAKKFIEWQEEIKKSNSYIKKITAHTINGNLERTIKSLLPLKMIQSTRHLFIPTSGGWTAMLDNRYRGTDPAAISYLPELLHSRSVWVVAIPHTLQPTGTPRSGRQGALIMEVYGHEQREWLNLIRTVRLEYDAGKLEFHQSGEVFSFEEIERYQNKRLRDRFDFDMLSRYLKALGLSPFEEEFYLPSYGSSSILVEISIKHPGRNRDITLEEARQLNGIIEIW